MVEAADVERETRHIARVLHLPFKKASKLVGIFLSWHKRKQFREALARQMPEALDIMDPDKMYDYLNMVMV